MSSFDPRTYRARLLGRCLGALCRTPPCKPCCSSVGAADAAAAASKAANQPAPHGDVSDLLGFLEADAAAYHKPLLPRDWHSLGALTSEEAEALQAHAPGDKHGRTARARSKAGGAGKASPRAAAVAQQPQPPTTRTTAQRDGPQAAGPGLDGQGSRRAREARESSIAQAWQGVTGGTAGHGAVHVGTSGACVAARAGAPHTTLLVFTHVCGAEA